MTARGKHAVRRARWLARHVRALRHALTFPPRHGIIGYVVGWA